DRGGRPRHAGEILLDGAIAEQVEPDQAAAHNHQENEGNEEALDHAYTGSEAKNSKGSVLAENRRPRTGLPRALHDRTQPRRRASPARPRRLAGAPQEPTR